MAKRKTQRDAGLDSARAPARLVWLLFPHWIFTLSSMATVS